MCVKQVRIISANTNYCIESIDCVAELLSEFESIYTIASVGIHAFV